MKNLVLISLLFILPLHAAEKVALVIGADKYDHMPSEAQLLKAVSDAKLMSDTLSSMATPFGVSKLYDKSLGEWHKEISAFTAKAKGAEIAAFYFSGHGLEFEGENYLLPGEFKMWKTTLDRKQVRRCWRNGRFL